VQATGEFVEDQAVVRQFALPPTAPRGGVRGGMSRLQQQAVSRDASFGSGGGSPLPERRSPGRPAQLGGDLRSGSFKFAQVSCAPPCIIKLLSPVSPEGSCGMAGG
jgi:hypothetical protein